VTVHKIRMTWNTGTDEVDLGTCYAVGRPQRGELISFDSDNATEQTGVWRVVEVYHQPFMEGSPAWQNWRVRSVEPEPLIDYFVVPADGPWRP
jgi:hypothetical protein